MKRPAHTTMPARAENNVAPAAAPTRLLDLLTSDERKRFPMAAGLLDYFPDALALTAEVSFLGNEKHNPGQPLHHARDKSSDHADCIMRHLTQRGTFDVITVNGVEHKVRHSAALVWRALALCQEEVERDASLGTPRGATDLPPR